MIPAQSLPIEVVFKNNKTLDKHKVESSGYKVIKASTLMHALPSDKITVWHTKYATTFRYIANRGVIEIHRYNSGELFVTGSCESLEKMNMFMETYNLLSNHITSVYINN